MVSLQHCLKQKMKVVQLKMMRHHHHLGRALRWLTHQLKLLLHSQHRIEQKKDLDCFKEAADPISACVGMWWWARLNVTGVQCNHGLDSPDSGKIYRPVTASNDLCIEEPVQYNWRGCDGWLQSNSIPKSCSLDLYGTASWLIDLLSPVS